MKLLLDQGLPRSTRDLLRHYGHEVTHVGDVGLACNRLRFSLQALTTLSRGSRYTPLASIIRWALEAIML